MVAVVKQMQQRFGELQALLATEDWLQAQGVADSLTLLGGRLPAPSQLSPEDKAALATMAEQLPALIVRLQARKNMIGDLLNGLAGKAA